MRASTFLVVLVAAIVLSVLSAGPPAQAGGLHADLPTIAVEPVETREMAAHDRIVSDECHDTPECNISVFLSSMSQGHAFVATSSKKRRVSPSLFKLLYSMTDPPVPRSMS